MVQASRAVPPQTGRTMADAQAGVAKRLAWIAAGYVLALVGGSVAVAVNEALMPAVISDTSGGMVAFGDVVLFLEVASVIGLVPTWFLLRLLTQRAPRFLLVAELAMAALGPASWLSVIAMATVVRGLPSAVATLIGPFAAFVAIPRIVVGPGVLVVEAVTFLLMRGRVARVLLAGAMLMDLIPLGVFALRFLTSPH